VITEKKLEIAMRTKRRARNVFAEPIDLSGSFQSARFPKSPYVKGTIRQALLSNFVFSTLTPSEIEDFVDYMKMEKFEAGSDVIKQGEPGDYFYVVESGSFTYAGRASEASEAVRTPTGATTRHIRIIALRDDFASRRVATHCLCRSEACRLRSCS